jgi:hypothetical protein
VCKTMHIGRGEKLLRIEQVWFSSCYIFHCFPSCYYSNIFHCFSYVSKLADGIFVTYTASYIILTNYGRVCERSSPCFKKSGLEILNVKYG